MLDHSCGGGRHSYAKRGADMYPTPSVATEALLRVEQLPARIWEPAAGDGAIVDVLREHGREVVASDLADYGFPLDFAADFPALTAAPAGVDAIVTNPPFRLAEQLVAHALKLCPRVVMLVRLAFLESERADPSSKTAASRVSTIIRRRLRMMHGSAGPGGRRAPPSLFVGSSGTAGTSARP